MDAVSQILKDTLTDIFEIEELENFFLAGGTNLALKYHHRISTDIDLFCLQSKNINIEYDILPLFEKKFGNQLIKNSINKNIVRININNIKVDLLSFFDLKLLSKPTIKIENWILCQDIDVAAMKIKAIINRGTLKDFYDLAFLLEKHSIDEILNTYKKNYEIQSDCEAIKYLVDFSEAELENINNISLINFQLSWNEVKEKIIKSTKNYLKQT